MYCPRSRLCVHLKDPPLPKGSPRNHPRRRPDINGDILHLDPAPRSPSHLVSHTTSLHLRQHHLGHPPHNPIDPATSHLPSFAPSPRPKRHHLSFPTPHPYIFDHIAPDVPHFTPRLTQHHCQYPSPHACISANIPSSTTRLRPASQPTSLGPSPTPFPHPTRHHFY